MKKKQLLSYKGYHGSVEYSLKDNILYGKVIDINGLISYEGKTIDELKKDFQGAVDDYLTICADNGEQPEKPYSGSFNVRISSKLHKQLVLYAKSHNESLNASVNEAVKEFITSKRN